MKKLPCLAIILVALELSAQHELATPSQVNSFFEYVRRADSALTRDVSGKLIQYYDRSDFFTFRGKDMIKDSVEVKDFLLRSYSQPVGGLTMVFAYLGTLFSKNEISRRTTAEIESMRRANDSLFKTTMLGSLNSSSPRLRPCQFSFRIVDSLDVVIPGARCYILSRNKCLQLLCGDCEKEYADNCSDAFMWMLRQTEYWDPVNSNLPLNIYYGFYTYYIVAGGKILKKDYLDIHAGNASLDRLNVRKISIGSHD